MVDIATLGIEVDSTDLKHLQKEMRGTTDAAKKTETATGHLSKEFERLERALNPALKAERDLKEMQGIVNREYKAGRIDLERYNKTLKQVNSAHKMSTLSMGNLRHAAGQLGFQIQDIAVQLQTGTDALMVFGQQGSQIASLFGPAGAVVGAVIAVSGAIGGALVGALRETEEEASEFESRMQGIAKGLRSFRLSTVESDLERQRAKVNELQEEYRQLNDKLDVLFRSGSQDQIEATTDRIRGLSSEIKQANEVLSALGNDRAGILQEGSTFDDVQQLTQKYEEYADTLGLTGRELALYRLAQIEVKEGEEGAIADAVERINAAYDEIEAFDALKQARNDLAQQAKEEEQQHKRNLLLWEREQKAINSVINRLDPLGRATQSYTRSHALLEKALESGSVDLARYVELMASLDTELDNAKMKLVNQDLEELFEDSELFGMGGGESKIADGLSESMSRVWVEFLRDGDDAASQIAGIFQNRMLQGLDQNVLGPIFASLTGESGQSLGATLSQISSNQQALGALGQFAGTAIGGGGQSSGIGSALGGLGAAALGFGPVGLLVGGLIGGIGGGLFDKDPLESKIQLQSGLVPILDEDGKPIALTVQSARTPTRVFENLVTGQSVFGTVGFTEKSRGIDQDLERLTQAFVDFDDSIAQFLSVDEITAAGQALAEFRTERLDFTEENFFELLARRVDTINESLDSSMTKALSLLADAASGFDEFSESLQEFANLSPQLSVLFGATADQTASLLTGTSGAFQQSFIDSVVSRNGNSQQFAFDVAQQTLNDVVGRTGVTFKESVDFVEQWQAGMVDINAIGHDLVETYQQVFIAGQAAEDAQKALIEVEKQRAELAEAQTRAAFQSATDAAYSSLVDAVGRRQSELEEVFDKEIKGIDELYDSQRENARDLAEGAIAQLNSQLDIAKTRLSGVTSVFRSLDSTLETITPHSLGRRLRAQASIQDAIALARSGGSLSGLEFDTASLRAGSSQYFGSAVDFQRDQLLTQIALTDLTSLASEQMTDSERTVELLEDQIELERDSLDALLDKLDDQQADAERIADEQHQAEVGRLDDLLKNVGDQIDHLRGIDTNILSIAEALGATTTAIVAESMINNTFDPPKTPQPDYSSYAGGIVFGGGIVPMYASGGVHAGGLRVVGENGPELEFTGPSRILSNRDSKQLLSYDELIAEVKALRQEVSQGNYTIAKNTMYTRQQLEDWDARGLPVEREL